MVSTSARGYAAVMLLMPSMIVSGGGNSNVQLDPGMIVFGGRGGRGNEGQAQLDGLGTGAAINGGGVSGYGQLEIAQEVVFTTAGGLGEAEVGGPVVNLIPKTGGNTFQHHFYISGMSGWMQSSNYTQELKDLGMSSPQKTNYLWESVIIDVPESVDVWVLPGGKVGVCIWLFLVHWIMAFKKVCRNSCQRNSRYRRVYEASCSITAHGVCFACWTDRGMGSGSKRRRYDLHAADVL